MTKTSFTIKIEVASADIWMIGEKKPLNAPMSGKVEPTHFSEQEASVAFGHVHRPRQTRGGFANRTVRGGSTNSWWGRYQPHTVRGYYSQENNQSSTLAVVQSDHDIGLLCT